LPEVFLWPQQNCQCKISSNKHKVFTAETASKKVAEKALLYSSSLFHSSFRDVIPVACVWEKKKHTFLLRMESI
jgi:hypothetical protein